MSLPSQDPDYQDTKRKFLDFLDQDREEGVYAHKISKMLGRSETRIIVGLDDLRVFDFALSRSLLESPKKHLPAIEEAFNEFLKSRPEVNGKQMPSERLMYHVGFSGPFGDHLVTPRTLTANFLGKLVCVEGIVTKCSIVRPKVKTSFHFCPTTQAVMTMEYRDATSLVGNPTSSVYPTKDKDNNVLETDFGLSVYEDHQVLTVQEMPEKSPPGQLPRSVEIILDDDLVNALKPGDRVHITGIYRALAGRASGAVSGTFRTAILANYVQPLAKDTERMILTESDHENIVNISRRSDVFELLGRSVATSIYGHDLIKKAIILILVGGVEKNLENGTHIRGGVYLLFCIFYQISI